MVVPRLRWYVYMKPNLRVLTFVGAIAVSIAAGVVLVRFPVVTFSERIADRGAPSSEVVSRGLILRPGAEGISIEVPDCDPARHHEHGRFLLHIFLGAPDGGVNPNFVNRDFDLTAEPMRRVKSAKGESCIIDRPYASAVPKMIVVGQFTMPEGRCCDVVWSRNYMLAY